GFKIASYSGGNVYTAPLTADGSGTYDIGNVTNSTVPGGGPEGLAVVPGGSAAFTAPRGLVRQESNGVGQADELDTYGIPKVSTDRPFITGLTGAEGAYLDTTPGDFLFSTYGGSNQVVVVSGFASTAFRITTSSPLPDATHGVAYSTTLHAVNGIAPYKWKLLKGGPKLPKKLKLNAKTGVISGTPLTAGSYTFTVVVADHTPKHKLTAQKQFTLTVN